MIMALTTVKPGKRVDLDTDIPRAVGYHKSARGRVADIAAYLLLIILTLGFLLPFYLMIRNGLSTRAEITSPEWTIFPADPQWENLTTLFTDPDIPMASSLVNSSIIAIGTTIGTLLFCSLAGYGLARIPNRAANAIFYAIVATLMIPAAVTFVPSFIIVSTLGWVSDFRGLIIPGLFSGFTTFLFRQYFLGFPKELEEAARVDGLGYWRTFWRIVFPNSGAFFAAIAVITFIGSWNSFLWPLIVAQDQSSWTVQVTLSTFITAQTINIPLLFMAAVVSILPLVFVFIFLQRFLVAGVAQTGIKG
jgi:multiple sugar transport system permease protein